MIDLSVSSLTVRGRLQTPSDPRYPHRNHSTRFIHLSDPIGEAPVVSFVLRSVPLLLERVTLQDMRRNEGDFRSASVTSFPPRSKLACRGLMIILVGAGLAVFGYLEVELEVVVSSRRYRSLLGSG